MKANDAKELRELRDENQRLKRRSSPAFSQHGLEPGSKIFRLRCHAF